LKRGRWRGVSTPGSLAALPAAGGGTSLLVCNNYSHRVTRHRLELSGETIRSWYDGTLRRGIRVPDGIAVSADGQWVAVSSHETSDVKLYTTANLGWRAKPAGVLEGVRYPHGLRFTADGRHILVADAGAPVVLTYRSDGSWDGPRDPLRVTRVMDDALFERGQALPDGSRTDQEGGPKGLDIDVSQRVVVTTCKVQTLAAFSLESLVSHPG
jgi:DNA-binding beta-propeller fold protein YncE